MRERNLGNIFELETTELMNGTKEMIECLDPFVDLYEAGIDIFTIKDPFISFMFMLVCSLCILHYEMALALVPV